MIDESGDNSYTATLSTTAPMRSGYTFIGWSTTANGAAQYQAGGSIILQEATPNVTLYAVWQQKTTLSDVANMQQMTAEICSNSAEHESKQLIDTRDNKSYWVAKLKDGNCWMTQNLDYDGYGTKLTSPSSWQNSGSTAYYYDSGSTTHGNYYNWLAATKGTGSGVVTRGENASDSICPSGWKLPPVEGAGSFQSLANSVQNSLSTLTGTPYNFVFGGYVYSASIHSVDKQFFYWTSTAYNSATAYTLSGNSSGYLNAARADSIGKDFGFSVRCLVSSW